MLLVCSPETTIEELKAAVYSNLLESPLSVWNLLRIPVSLVLYNNGWRITQEAAARNRKLPKSAETYVFPAIRDEIIPQNLLYWSCVDAFSLFLMLIF